MKNFIFIFSIIVLFIFQPLFAQEERGVGQKKVGQSTMNFLQVSVVPEATALGDAYTAYGTGVQSLFYNPAGLSEMSHKAEVFVSNVQWIADINYIGGAAAWNLNEYGSVGLNFITVDYGDIHGTQLLSSDEAATNQQGFLETGLVDNVGAYAFGLYYSKKISNLFSVGLGARYVAQQLGTSEVNGSMRDNEESKIAFDLGVKYYTPIEGFRFGMTIRNFSTEVKYEEVSAPLPITFSLGAAMDLTKLFPVAEEANSIVLTSEFTHPNNYTERVHFGLEYEFMKMLALRGGYITNHDVNGLSLGIGLNANISGTSTKISYTYSAMDVFDDVNRFSVMFAF
jgi:hypothetical protein